MPFLRFAGTGQINYEVFCTEPKSRFEINTASALARKLVYDLQ